MKPGPVRDAEAMVAPSSGATGSDTAALRHVFGQYPTGVAVATACDAQGRVVAMTINSFSSLSLHPPLVAWSIGARSADLAAFAAARWFGISVLSSAQEALARRFADPQLRREAANVALLDFSGQAPRVPDAVGWLLCSMHRTVALGDHLLIVGQVEHFDALPGEALAYHRGRYARIDGRATP
jgi:flavin reductase (DIM6/NTAB) family NADH-FMN oxidoreductase RutF